MRSLDFEEFLWACGYDHSLVEDLYSHMKELKPLSALQMQKLTELFRYYMIIGGMPEVVNTFVKQGNFGGTLQLQQQLLQIPRA